MRSTWNAACCLRAAHGWTQEQPKPHGSAPILRPGLAEPTHGGKRHFTVCRRRRLLIIPWIVARGQWPGSRRSGGRGASWFLQVMWSIPTLPMVLAITLAFGKGFLQVFLAIGLTMWVVSRIVRGQFLGLREQAYVQAAEALDLPAWRVMVRHMLPNGWALVVRQSFRAILICFPFRWPKSMPLGQHRQGNAPLPLTMPGSRYSRRTHAARRCIEVGDGSGGFAQQGDPPPPPGTRCHWRTANGDDSKWNAGVPVSKAMSIMIAVVGRMVPTMADQRENATAPFAPFVRLIPKNPSRKPNDKNHRTKVSAPYQNPPHHPMTSRKPPAQTWKITRLRGTPNRKNRLFALHEQWKESHA